MTSSILFFVFAFYFTRSKCNFLRFSFCYDNGYYLEEKFSSQYQCTLGCVMQERDRLLFFQFFSHTSLPQILLRPLSLLILATVAKSPVSLLSIKNTRQYLFCVLVLGGCLKRPYCIAFMF